jgi:hypothetical protein
VSIPTTGVRRLAGAAVALTAAAAMALAGAAPALAADTDGYVRLAHLSPDTPAVDVYLKDQSSDAKPQVFPGVGYGVMSPYLRVPAGSYQVAMRPAGAAATTDPVLTTEVNVAADQAYTVAGVGKYADLGLRVLTDDLKLPSADQAKVRIIQASVKQPMLDVGSASGTTIADDVQFATTTAYRQVRPGNWTVKVAPPSGNTAVDLPCTLGAGNVYSLLVLDKKGGGLTTQLRLDASRQGTVPSGAVATGGGGTQPASRLPMALLIAGIAALVAGGAVVAVRRRPQIA